MFYYARSDTHYLLYVYDLIRNELNEKSNSENPEENYMEHVLDRSKETSLRRFEKMNYDAESGQGSNGWFNMLMKQSSGNFSREQFAVFRAVHKWRDDLARAEDESPMFIMSNQSIFDISRRLPPDPKALFGLISHPSHLVKQRISDLFKVVEKAMMEGASGPSLTEFFSEKARDASGQSVGAVTQHVFPQLKDSGSVVDTRDLVSETSQLWGQVPISSRWETTNGANRKAPTVEFALPWATFMEDASVTNLQPSAVEMAAQHSSAMEVDQQGDTYVEDAEFTLKLGKKRKAVELLPKEETSIEEGETTPNTAADSSALLDGDTISVNDTSEEEAREKARRKTAKKVRKERKKEKSKVGESGGDATEAAEEEEPFDYSKANSVLNTKRVAATGAGKDSKGKIFNPYSKLSIEGPKAARRMHGEKPGKSATFKKI